MKFTKMQGCGNDYIYVNCFDETVPDPSAAAIRLSDRHFGIGGDGLVLICPSDAADFCMEMYNADGSRSEMCGNAIRCVGKYVHDRGLTDKTELTIETRAGIKTLWLNVVDGAVETVRVCMGSPEFRPEKIPVAAEGETFLEQPIDVLGETWIVSSVNSAHRPRARKPQAIPRAGEYRVCRGRGRSHAACARVGARQRRNARLRYGLYGGAGCHGAAGQVRRRGGRDSARRQAAHRMGPGAESAVYDRPRGICI